MKSYTFKKFKKQLLPYLLSFAIVLGAFSWKAPEADAIATEAVVAAIISVAIGSGLAFAVDRMTSPEVDAYWTGQAQQWLQSIGQSYSDFVDQAEQNMSAKDGKLILGGSFYQSIQNFLSWWRGSVGVEEPEISAVVFSSYGTITRSDGVIFDVGLWIDANNFSLPASMLTDRSYVCDDNQFMYFNTSDFVLEFGRTGRAKATWTDLNGTSRTRSFTSVGNKTDTPRWFCVCPTGSEGVPSFGIVYCSKVGNPPVDTYYYSQMIPNAADLGFGSSAQSLTVSQPSDFSSLETTEALPSVALDVGASSEDDLETVIRAVFDGYRDNTLVVDQELTGAGEGEGTDTDGLFGILHGISGTLSDVLDAVLSIPATLAATVTGFIGSIGNFLSGAYFGFSGIWHYVVTWVGSMAAGAAVIWSIWNGLPSAMVIPVFATAVIVIVVGLWRRFFE